MISKNKIIFLEKKQGLSFLGLFVISIVIFPFLNLFHLFYPLVIFGKSAWVVIPVIIIGVIYLSVILNKISALLVSDLWGMVIIFASWIIFAVRDLFYEESRNFLDIRFIATSVIFIALSSHLVGNLFLMRIIAYAVFIQSMLVAFARIINFYLFPFFSAVKDEDGTLFLNMEGELTRDLLIGSSISANHIVCGMFVLLSLYKNKIIKLNQNYFMLFQFFLMLSTFNTGSRFPMSISIFVFFLSLSNLNLISLKNIIALILTCCGLFAIFSLTQISSYDYFSRFSQGSGGRDAKFEATIILISNSFVDFLVGSSDRLVNTTAVNGILISDNSYGLVATSFGVPFMLFFFGYLIFTLKKRISDDVSLFLIIYTVIGLAITNCILWESWIFTVFMSFAVVACFGGVSKFNIKKFPINTGIV